MSDRVKIGLLSDTHSYLDPALISYFKNCDELWHAGDIGSMDVVETLESYKPLRAVHGNIDNHELMQRFPEDLFFTCAGANVFISHIGGKPPKYNKRIRDLITLNKPDIFVCGHSHILRVIYDKTNKLLFLNPGAVGRQGFHRQRTAIRFEIEDGKPKDMQVIELGPRS